MRRRQRDAEQRVGAQARLVRRAVEGVDQRGRGPAGRRAGWPTTASAISPLTLATASQDALAAVALRVAVAQLVRLVACRCWRRTGRWRGPRRRLRGATSTSTVGLPRESSTSRARTAAMRSSGMRDSWIVETAEAPPRWPARHAASGSSRAMDRLRLRRRCCQSTRCRGQRRACLPQARKRSQSTCRSAIDGDDGVRAEHDRPVSRQADARDDRNLDIGSPAPESLR